jgi:hypothetical protein
MRVQHEELKRQIDQAMASMPARPMREDVLNSLIELNTQFLELLAEQGRVDATRIDGLLLREVSHRWSEFDAEAKRRAASCPYLLVDAGFGDPDRWRTRGFAARSADTPAFFTVDRCRIVARQVFLYAWHLSNSRTFEGRVLLGMCSDCIEALRSYTLPQVLELAEQSTHSIWPRWPHLVGFWRELLLAARSGEFAALEAAKMHGIPLLAADFRAAFVRALQVQRAADTTSRDGPQSRALPCDCGGTLFDELAGLGRAFPRRPCE